MHEVRWTVCYVNSHSSNSVSSVLFILTQMNVQMAQQALEMEEAMYLQRQQELDRDIHVHRFLLQEQLQQEALSKAAASLHASRLYFAGGLGGGGLAAQLQEREFLLQHQEQVRRQQQLQQQMLSQTQNTERNTERNTDRNTEKRAGDSLPSTPVRRATASNASSRKRSFDVSEADTVPSNKRAARPTLSAAEKAAAKASSAATGKPKASRKKQSPALSSLAAKKPAETLPSKAPLQKERDETVAVEALADFGDVPSGDQSESTPAMKGTVESLLTAANAEEKLVSAAGTMAKLKITVDRDALTDSVVYEPSEVIDLPNFRSVLPRLPSEPECSLDAVALHSEPPPPVADSESKARAQPPVASKNTTETKSGALSMTVDYPYPVDTWWPSITTIRRERRSKGEKSDEEDFIESSNLPSESDAYFRADLTEIHRRLATESEPGVLEKFPHCRIHRMAMKEQKVANAPDHAFCWQVTENYCNDAMVCCSICSTWRHARCGGHYKSVTIRETTKAPFVPVCDRCHAEREILRDFPKAELRLERQRVEQLRRALATSHVIRQASFAKHSGTYKWPLGSVSMTHISGHTRSVHSRHDKAEKQWSEMVTRLSRASGYRPKERVKVRTRELERLLVSVEDSEGITDRHNMLLFLEQDTSKEKPVGYQHRQVNIFDPEDDLIPSTDDLESESAKDDDGMVDEKTNSDNGEDSDLAVGRRLVTRKFVGVPQKANATKCASLRCSCKPRFDSIFCSDACGVASLELDLLHAFKYANDIHPTLLRT